MKSRKLYFVILSLVVMMVAATALVSAQGAGILEDKYDEVDFEGATVNIGGDWLDNYLSEDRLTEAEEKFNVEINNMDWLNNEQRVSRVMAGDSTHDIWKVNNIDFTELAADGVVYPIEDDLGSEYYEAMIENDPENEYIYKSTRLTFNDQGYSLTPLNPVYGVLWFWLYNRDIVEEEGLTDPQELLENEEWTWDAAQEMMEQVTRDLDGDGDPDQYGLGNITTWLVAISNGENVVEIDEEGNYIYNVNSEPVLDGMRKYVEWQNDAEVVGSGDDFDAGDALFSQETLWEWNTVEIENWGILPIPRGPNAEHSITGAWDAYSPVIPINAEDPEALAVLWDFLSEPEVFPRDETKEIANQRSDLEVVEKYFAQREFPLVRSFLLDESVTDVLEEVLDGERGVEEAFNSVEPEAQSYLDDFFGQ